MFTLACDITIGKTRLNQVNDLKIEKSWKNLDDKAMIKLPRVNKLLSENFKAGDPVSICLAYEGIDSCLEFEGYVKKVKPNIPLIIECEDPTWLLRQTSINHSWKGQIKLHEVVSYIIDEVNKQGLGKSVTLAAAIDDIILTDYPISGVSAAEAINNLRKTYGLAAYFRGHELYVGLAYGRLLGDVAYDVSRNVIKNNLTFRNAEDVKVRVKATSIQKNNEFRTIEIGDTTGDQRSLFFYNIEEGPHLENRAKTELEKLKYDGYEGYITTFLIPYAAPGMTGVITDPDHPKLKNGSYVIDSVTTTFGTKGARRKIELGTLVGTKIS